MPRINRRAFLQSIGVAAAAVAVGKVRAQSAPKRPNFVIILADDMGYSTASAYDGWVPTPGLERMAREGMKFTDFHSSGAVCSPTRAGLLTGRYQERAGIPGVVYANPDDPAHDDGLQDVEVTFAELLGEAGYAAGIMGKWHLGYLPQYNPARHGFDVFHGYVSGNVDYVSHYDNQDTYDWWNGTETAVEDGYSTHLITRHALEFIDAHRNDPFCLYIAHEAVHSPFQGPNSKIQRGPDKGKPDDGLDLSKEEAYVQMMTELDKGVTAVLDRLIERGLDKNTLVFFLSDNGQEGNTPHVDEGPLRGHKSTVWEGGHRVPAIAWWPGTIKPGASNDGLFISIDLMPTMLALAGLPQPTERPLDGVAMDGVLLRGEAVPERALFWRGQAMREGRWKFVDGGEGGLFNLEDDLGETRDLSSQYPERVRAMRAALEAWKEDVARTATPQPGETPARAPGTKRNR